MYITLDKIEKLCTKTEKAYIESGAITQYNPSFIVIAKKPKDTASR